MRSSLDDLDRGQRRRLVVRSALRVCAATVVLAGLYVSLPVAGKSDARSVLGLGIGLVVFAAVLVWQIRGIVEDRHPEVRAVEALAFAAPVLIVVFAFTYLSLSRADTGNFSQPLDRVGAIYFTVSVLTTVGFGDIAAKTDAARLIVSAQMLLDLVLIAGVARTVVVAARIGLRRQEDATEPSDDVDIP